MFTCFISADWSKDPRKRSVYVACLDERQIRKAYPGPNGWNLETMLALAREQSRHGRVLVGVDLALGVSEGYWQLLLDEYRGQWPATFLDWLRGLDPRGGFFETTTEPEKWRADRPWFKVRQGEGGLRSFTEKVDDCFLRPVDMATGANPLFAVSGIPGTVGSATREFWKELIPRLGGERDFAIWPFEESLVFPCTGHPIVLAESYPGLAYAAALARSLPACPIRIGKTKEVERDLACNILVRAGWVVRNRVDLGEFGPARDSEDDFDAHITAAAVLRCVVEGVPLADENWIDTEVKGSMLLAGPVDPKGKAKKLSACAQELRPLRSDLPLSSSSPSRRSTEARRDGLEHPCPIPGCHKVFTGTRSGWDAHIGSSRKHPDWYPEVMDSVERKRLFKRDYPEWFNRASERSTHRDRTVGEDVPESTGVV